MNNTARIAVTNIFLMVTGLAVAEPLQPPYSWRGIDGSGVFPAGDLVANFREITDQLVIPDDPERAKKLKQQLGGAKPGETKNIVWRTLLPHWGHSTPVVVGDKETTTRIPSSTWISSTRSLPSAGICTSSATTRWPT